MAVKNYLDKDGLSHVASYVNGKLTVVSSMPTLPTDLRTVLYIGPTTDDYAQGGIYILDTVTNEWILISTADVSLYETSFTGTQAEWDALSAADQARYEIVNITDDFVESEDAAGVVAGYYYNGNFYEDSAHTTQISGLKGYIYIDLTEDKLYLYDGSQFVINSGAGGGVVEGYYNSTDGKFYEESTFVTEITGQSGLLYVDVSTNYVYRYDTTQSEFVQVSGGGSSYTAGFGVKIANDEISTRDFVGTQAEWDAKTAAQKAEYDFIHITDDASQASYAPGHAISDGTSEKTQREVLEFNGFDVTDDSVNGKTKIAEVPYMAGRGVAITNKEVAVDETIATTFTGTQAEWNALTATEKAKYNLVNITDDAASGAQVVVDEVTEGNMNAVSSNAVAEALGELPQFKFVSYSVPSNTISANSSGIISIPTSFNNTQYNICSITFGLGANNADCLLYYEGQTTSAINVGYVTGSTWNTQWIWNINILLIKK